MAQSRESGADAHLPSCAVRTEGRGGHADGALKLRGQGPPGPATASPTAAPVHGTAPRWGREPPAGLRGDGGRQPVNPPLWNGPLLVNDVTLYTENPKDSI